MRTENRPPLASSRRPAASGEASRANAKVAPTAATEPTRLCPISAKIGRELWREIDAYAEAHGITRSRAAAQYLDIASEAIREREGIPGGRADELMEVLEGLRVLIDMLGPPTFATLRLLAHWASRTDVKVPEDELLAELRGVGADEWEQAVTDAERSLHEVARQAGRNIIPPEGRA
jgi:hypothetical protein